MDTIKPLWRMTLIIQSLVGLSGGLYLFTYGPFFYDHLGGNVQPHMAMIFTSTLLAVRQGLVALLEVPTGALADAIGRVHTVVLSMVSRVFFFLGFAAVGLCVTPSSAFVWGIAASVAFAFNTTLFNGAFSAWCADTLSGQAPSIPYSWLASRFHSYQVLTGILGAVIGILLYVNHLAVLGFVLAALLSAVCMVYCVSVMKETPRQHVHEKSVLRHMKGIIRTSMVVCHKTPVLFWVVFTFGSYLFLLNIVLYLWPVYFQSVAGDKIHFTRNWMMLTVLTEGMAFLGSRFFVMLNNKWGSNMSAHLAGYRRIFIGFALSTVVVVVTFSLQSMHLFTTNFCFPLTVIVVNMSYGLMRPCYESLVNVYLPSGYAQNRATVLSIGSMLRSVLVLLLAVPSGGSSSESSPIFWSIPAMVLLVALVGAYRAMRRTEHASLGLAPCAASEGEAI